MNASIRLSIAIALVFVTNLCFAQIPPPVETAIKNTAGIEKNTWAYTRTETRDKELWIERFDPNAKSYWTLIGVDGKEPDDKQITAAKKRQENRLQNTDDYYGKNDFSNLADPASWKLLENDPDFSTYFFRPSIDAENESFVEALNGELTIDNKSRTIHSFRVYNTKPFKPAAVAKIKNMSMTITYQQVHPGTYLPATIEAVMKGRVFGVKKINVTERIEFSDFEPRLNSASDVLPDNSRLQ